jgi:hypothetical protein
MLKKVAIGQSFQLAFPEEMGGMPYMEEELPDMAGSSLPSVAQGVIEEEKDEDISEQPAEAVEDVTPTCEVCGKALTAKVAEYSMGKFGKYLCTTHQKASVSTTTVDPAEVDATLPATDEQKEELKLLIMEGKLDKKYQPKIASVSYATAVQVLERFKTETSGGAAL